MKKLHLILLIVICMSLQCVCGFAAQRNDIQFIEKIDIPEYLNIKIEYTLVEKPFFNQISIRDDGWFSLTTTCSERSLGLTYGTYFADVYDQNGEFQFSIRIDGVQDPMVSDLDQESLMLYFLHYVIVYDLATSEITCFKTRELVTQSDYYRQLKQTQKVIGDKQYTCKSGLEGYTKIIIEEAGEKKTLLSFSGNGGKYIPLCLPIFIAFAIVIKIVVQRRSSRTGDGLREPS